MAILDAVLKARRGKRQVGGGRMVRTYEADYRLRSSVLNEDPSVVLSYAGLPSLLSTWPSDETAVCISLDPDQDREMPDAWDVKASYTNYPEIRSPDDAAENPLLRPAVIERNPQNRQRILQRDVNGVLIVNAAREYFDPPLEREEHPPAITITKNMVAWPYAIELAYTDAINSDALVVPAKGIAYAAGLVKCNGFSGSEQYESGFAFWQVSVALEVDWEGWNKPIPNLGFSEKGTARPKPILGENGEAISKAAALDANGVVLPYGSDPIYLNFAKHRAVSFAALLALFGL